MTILGNAVMLHFFNLGKLAGQEGVTAPCPYTENTARWMIWAWEQGRDEALEAAA